jgi:hypothetical protein
LFTRACALIEAALAGDERRRLVKDLCAKRSPSVALSRLAHALRTNLRELDRRYAALDSLVSLLDARTRRDGFHVLHDWDGAADRFNPETIVVDVASFAVDRRGDESGHETVAAILLDYHYLGLLALLSLRVWDEGDPDANLDRLDALLAALHANGSGHRFASRAATLLLIATAHYEPDERGYDALLEKVRTLDRGHRRAVAIDHAAAMGCHLRFGFEASYGRDVGLMRADNAADYPWLQFVVSTLIDAYVSRADEAIAEALINSLTPDPGRFAADLPQDRGALLDAFEGFRPSDASYSPLAFFFNFSHNVVKGLVVDAVLRGRPWPITLNDLLTSLPPEGGSGQTAGTDDAEAFGVSRKKMEAARTLMESARRAPSLIRGRLTPAIVYDVATGRHAFGATLRRLRDERSRTP